MWLRSALVSSVYNNKATFFLYNLYFLGKTSIKEAIIMGSEDDAKIKLTFKSTLLKISLFALHPKGERLVLIESSITALIPGINYMSLIQN